MKFALVSVLAVLPLISDCAGPNFVGRTLAPPNLEITAINPFEPVHKQTWSVHFRLTNNWLARQPLTGWIEAIAYPDSDAVNVRAIAAQTYPIADLQANEIAEGDLVFPTTSFIGDGHVEVTFFNISSGYTPGPRSSDGVLPDVPPAVKVQLLNNGNARALSTAAKDVRVALSAEKLAVVFDFDPDSCYPSAAISDAGVLNPGLDEAARGLTSGCRYPAQLQSSHTYYRDIYLRGNGVDYGVQMYALYFMKDKTVEIAADAIGHRHDWEFALVWTSNGAITHASVSSHGGVDTKQISNVAMDMEGHVKVVYHKGPLTHEMSFASASEPAHNDLGRFFTPRLMTWYTMTSGTVSNEAMRQAFNNSQSHFGSANCSFHDWNFPTEVAKHPPLGYPSADEWRDAGIRDRSRKN